MMPYHFTASLMPTEGYCTKDEAKVVRVWMIALVPKLEENTRLGGGQSTK